MNKVYLNGNAVVVEIPNTYVVVNRTSFSYDLNDTQFVIADAGQKQRYEIGTFAQFTDGINTVFADIEEAKTYLNTLFLKQVGGTNGTTFELLTVGTAPNITRFESDGTPVYEGAATFWRDIDFPIIIRTTGANIPTLATLNGNLTMPQWEVNDFNISESQEFVHEWKEESTVFWHLHLTTNGTNIDNRFVKFTVEYGYVTPNGVWQFATMTTADLLIPANTPDRTMFILGLGNFTPVAGTRIGGHVVARLTRVASTGAAPTGNPFIPMLQLHISCDTNGSREMTTK